MADEAAPILIVEDDGAILNEMITLLSRWGFGARGVSDFSRAAEELARAAPALVILDVNLPYADGFSLCAELRRSSKAPVLMVSARNSTMDQVMALSQGADDYLTKPFDPQILVAKVRALLRRSYEYSATDSDELRCGGYVLSAADCSVGLGGAAVALTRNEFLAAQALMRARGALVGREALMQALWRDEVFVDDNTLSVNVSRLRRKLESLGAGDPIESVKGAGYRFAAGG